MTFRAGAARGCFTAGVLAASFSVPVGAGATVGAEPEVGARATIDVAVATLWRAPRIPRHLDRFSTTNPVDLSAWNRALRTTAARTWLVGPVRTQALYGQQVVVRARSGTWVQVAVVDEPDPRDPVGYTGWVPVEQLRPPLEPGDRSVVVLQPRARLDARDRDLTLSYGTRLPLAEQQEGPAVVAVTTPDGPGVIAATAVGPSKEPTRASILSDGRAFLGRRYLWGGLSSWGWDCSGLIWNLFRAHGRTIPRDADPQYRVGRPVSLRHLKPADLLFWGTRHHVHHVALYTGDGMMLEAPDSSGRVQVVPVRRTGLVGARRYLDR